MHLIEAHNVFAIRLYKWSKGDFLRELESGCPLLSSIGLNHRRIAALVAWNKTLSSEQRSQLSEALPMLFHDNARRLKGDLVTEAIKWWKNEVYMQTTRYMDRLPGLSAADRRSPTFQSIDPDVCLDYLASIVSHAILGKPSRQRSAVRCVRKIDDWRVVTVFTFQRSEKKLDCTFQFLRKDDKSRYPIPEDGLGPFPRNLFTFYGIYNHTFVTIESLIDSEPMSEIMNKLAEHFVEQADPLFSSLGIDD